MHEIKQSAGMTCCLLSGCS